MPAVSRAWSQAATKGTVSQVLSIRNAAVCVQKGFPDGGGSGTLFLCRALCVVV